MPDKLPKNHVLTQSIESWFDSLEAKTHMSRSEMREAFHKASEEAGFLNRVPDRDSLVRIFARTFDVSEKEMLELLIPLIVANAPKVH